MVHETITKIYFITDLIYGIDVRNEITATHPINIGGYYISTTNNCSCFIEILPTGILKYNSININGQYANNTTKVSCVVFKAP